MAVSNICPECGAIYDSASEARYCARADLDPRKENTIVRSGNGHWIPKPKGWANDTSN